MVSIFESVIIIFVAIFSTTFTALYLYFTRNFKFWHNLGIPYLKPAPFVGNLKDCALQKVNIGNKLQQIYNEHSDKPYVGIFSFDKPSLLIRDLELVKNVLVKDSQNFIDRVTTLDEKLDPLFGQSLFIIKGQKWRHLRSKLTPVFSSGKIKMMFYLVDICGKGMVEYLDRAIAEGPTVDSLEMMYRYTTDAIATCAFGINGHALEDPQSEFWRFLRTIFDFSVRKGLAGLTAFCAPALTRLFNLKFVEEDTNNYLRNIVWNTVQYREKNGVVRNDFLDCMMELRNKGKEEFIESIQSGKNTTDATYQIDGDLFVAQAFVFLAAGFETSGSTLNYAIYEIALNPEIQHRLRTEILSVLHRHNGQLTYDSIQEMTYLDMVVTETLRKYPIVSFLDRQCSSEYTVPAPSGNGTITLPAGTGVYVSVYAIQKDPKYYPEPEKFDPERFSEENKRKLPKCSYMPFGEGPRMCVGMRFGLMQVKTGLCHILPRFEVSPCKNTPVPVEFDTKSFLLTLCTEMPLNFKRIQQ